MNKKTISTIIAVIGLALVAFILWKGSTETKPEQKLPERYEVKEVAVTQLPPGMPADLPIEQGAVITQNHDVTDSRTDRRQADTTYITKKTITENFAAYKKYLSDKKWAVDPGGTLDQPDYKVLTATNGRGTLNIMFDYHKGAANNLVSIYYTYTPASTTQ